MSQLLSEPFYDLLEAGAQEASGSVRLLARWIESGGGDLDAFALSRRKSEQLAADIAARLARTVMAGLRKEDIEAISQALCRIPEAVERFAQRFSISRDRPGELDFTGLAMLVGKQADILVSMVSQLRVFNSAATTRKLETQMQEVDSEADKLNEALLGRVYAREADAVKVVMTQDLSEHMQAIIDRCRDAARVVNEIALKYD